MKNIIRTSFGIAFVILGIMAFVFDFMTTKKIINIISEDPYPLQWASVVGSIFCAGSALIFRVEEMPSMSRARNTNLKNKIKRSYYVKVNWWTSVKHGLNHNLEELGHVLKILH